MDDYHSLMARKKILEKDMHMLHTSIGNSKARDLSLYIDPMKDIEIVKNKSFKKTADEIKRLQENQYKKNHEHDRFLAANAASAKEGQYKYEFTCRDPEKRLPDTLSFGGTTSTKNLSYTNFHTNNLFKPEEKKDFMHNLNDYNNVVLQHNKLCQVIQAPRNKRNTLMLSNLGFSSHCSDIALEIVKILKEKNL